MRTTRFSAVIREFLKRYPDGIIKIDHILETRPVNEWCTNKKLSYLVNFSISYNNKDVLAFHDDSKELWTPIEELPYIKELASKKMVRYEISKKAGYKNSVLSCLFKRKA